MAWNKQVSYSDLISTWNLLLPIPNHSEWLITATYTSVSCHIRAAATVPTTRERGHASATTLVECERPSKLQDRPEAERRHLRGAGGNGWGAVTPKEKEKRRKKKERNMGTIWITSNYYNIKCCFFQFFNSPVALKNKNKIWPPRKSWNDAPEDCDDSL